MGQYMINTQKYSSLFPENKTESQLFIESKSSVHATFVTYVLGLQLDCFVLIDSLMWCVFERPVCFHLSEKDCHVLSRSIRMCVQSAGMDLLIGWNR